MWAGGLLRLHVMGYRHPLYQLIKLLIALSGCCQRKESRMISLLKIPEEHRVSLLTPHSLDSRKLWGTAETLVRA